MRTKIMLFITCSLVASLQFADAALTTEEKVKLSITCGSTQSLAVITGNDVPALLGVPLRQISLFAYSQGQLSPVSFQIDQKDPQGRYQMDATADAPSNAATLDGNDELVFRINDIGEKLPATTAFTSSNSVIEIEIGEPQSGIQGWIYARTSERTRVHADTAHIHYLADTDSVQSGLYHIGFAKGAPFLVETFRWKRDGTQEWGPDISDTMKIRHRGRFLGFIPFYRTQTDYSSRLVAVKQGPLRVIRRTSNRVRMLWKLNTPALYVDYVMMPDGFVMDTVIDIPFNIGLFFSDIETLTTMDWIADPQLPRLTVHPPDGVARLAVNGQMSAAKKAFNNIGARHFTVGSAFGTLSVQLDIPDDFPIEPWLYLRDDVDEPDPPENQAGQFGNVGFRTTGWERIDSGVQHLRFIVCMSVAPG